MTLIELLVLRMNSNPCVKLDSADTRVMVIDLIVALFDPKCGKQHLLFIHTGQASPLHLQLMVTYQGRQS